MIGAHPGVVTAEGSSIGSRAGVSAVSAVAETWDGVHDFSLAMDGSTEYLSAPDAASSYEHTGMTMLLAFRLDSGTYDGIMGYGDSGSSQARALMETSGASNSARWSAWSAAGAAQMEVQESPTTGWGTDTDGTGQYHMFVAAVDVSTDSVSALYAGGSAIVTGGTGANTDISADLDTFLIGARRKGGAYDRYCACHLLQAAIVTTKLDATEAAEASLTGDWRDATWSADIAHYWVASWSEGTSTVTLPDLVGSATATLVAGDATNLVSYP